MNALRLILKPIAHGWAIYLTDGQEVARLRGPGSKRRALCYLAVEPRARRSRIAPSRISADHRARRHRRHPHQ
jgi:hypothetical protein